MSRRAFVISPIGDPGSEERKHADLVFKFIIEPAMKECGIEAIRSDQLHEPGKISEQMFREILHDDLSIALLSGRNPNVFYELAIAQAHRRPVILLVEQGEQLPFDVQDHRCVTYTLDHVPLFDGEYKDLVVKQVEELAAAGWQTNPLFAESELTANAESFVFFRQARDWGASRSWEGLLDEAESVFEIMGLGLSGWGSKYARETLLEKALAGCAIRVMVVDPDNPSLSHSINDALEDEGLDILRQRIAGMYELFRGLADQTENIQVRKIAVGAPHMQVARTDHHAVCIPYLFSEQPAFSPLIWCSADHELYAAIAQEFASLWEANAASALGASSGLALS
jgi:hypothetical protein